MANIGQNLARGGRNSLAPSQKTFSSVISGQAMQAMLNKSLADPRRVASFTSTLISTVSASRKLQQCDPNTIIAAALRGEGMGLSVVLGQYSIVPYKTTANFQLSYKGLAQLAIRSGEYADIDVFDVRENEFKGYDRNRRPVIEWCEDEEAREKSPISGYYGYYELRNGFKKSVYWTHKKILMHANRYSSAFNLEQYEKLQKGELSDSDAWSLRNGSPWYDMPDSEAHMKMCKKTVLKQLLGDGFAPMSIDMRTAMSEDDASEQGGVIRPEEAFFSDSELPFDEPPVDPSKTPAETPEEAPKVNTRKKAQKPEQDISDAVQINPDASSQNSFFD
jgi:recombination protein RecT